uniref:Palmitoyl-protein thioesterase n=1 Tax=Trepomonas sp. PC1 TaxID=1076344 RepID=A0A146KGX1_9EUKA|eukprot:JAP94885.1 Palmitoyl-protein thioesterase [Trepomonas sp. PC1]
MICPLLIFHGFAQNSKDLSNWQDYIQKKYGIQSYSIEVLFGTISSIAENPNRYLRALTHNINKLAHKLNIYCFDILSYSQGGFWMKLFSQQNTNITVRNLFTVASPINGLKAANYSHLTIKTFQKFIQNDFFYKILKNNAIPSAYWNTRNDTLLSKFKNMKINAAKIISIFSKTDNVVPFYQQSTKLNSKHKIIALQGLNHKDFVVETKQLDCLFQ